MNRIYTLLLLIFSSSILFAQDKMRVERGDAVNNAKPIWNVFVDADNKKWVGNPDGLFQIHSINNGSKVNLGAGQWSLLQYRSGNADLRVSLAELKNIIPNITDINCAHLDEKKQMLWVGTTESGLFQMSLAPLKLVKNFTRDNSELETNFINFIEIEPNGRMWIGTPEGIVWGKNGRWNIDEKYLNFVGVAYNSTMAYVISEEWIWEVTPRNKWKEIELNPQQYKGLLIDAAVDSKGRLWLASEIISRTDLATETIEPFAAPEYYTSEFAAKIMVDQDDALWVGTRDKGLFVIEKQDAITVSVIVEKAISCGAFEYDGQLKVAVEGGKPPYEYAWGGNLKGTNPGNLGPGEYTVTVTDTKGVTKSASGTINDPAVIVKVKQDQHESGIGAGDGAATATVEGGVPDYKFAWDNGETKETATTLTGGKHTVTVTDDAGCSTTASVDIQQNIADLAIKIENTNELKCADATNASLTVAVEGGKPPYTYQWDNEKAKGENPSNLAAGIYKVTVNDDSGKSSTATFTIKAPEVLMANVEVDAPASTGNQDGKASVKVSGGTAPYQYKWDTGESGKSAAKFGEGAHEVTVTDANGCEMTAGFSIGENILPLKADIETVANVDCAGEKTGELSVAIKGGKPPFDYKWNSADASGEQPKGLGAGEYLVTVTDASGKTTTAKAKITAPNPIEVKLSLTSAANTNQKDGKVKAKVSGGKKPFSYKWTNGETGETATKLGAGTHTLEVKDSKGCVATADIEMTEDIIPLALELNIDKALNCEGDADGAISSIVKGGKSPFQYAWNTGASTEKIDQLKSGDYLLTITDQTGATATANVKIEAPKALAVTVSIVGAANANEKDGKAKAKVTGGTGTYTYKWGNGETGETASTLGAGKQTVEVKDSKGCVATAAIEMTEDIIALGVELTVDKNVACHGDSNGAISATVKGGKSPFTYKWNNGKTGTSIDNLAAGTYSITVSDASGLMYSTAAEVKQPEPIGIELTKTPTSNEVAKDGKAVANGVGGNGNYTFTWSTGATGTDVEKLEPGSYNVAIKDEKGCTADVDFKIKAKQIPNLSASTLRQGQTVKLEKLFFDADSASITPQSLPTLEELFDFLTENGSVAIEIGGHTNNIPPHEFCDKLSTERAKAVADYLTAKGIDPRRVLYKGYGKRKPKFTNKTKEGRKKNQRVEVKVLSI